ncbi:MAG TPA: hypothetical protein VH678_04060 [Xanthobacteraceae bacterium]
MTTLDETHCQNHVACEAGDQFPVFVRLIEIKPIDCVRIIEHESGNLESYAVLAVVPVRFPIVHSNSASRI